MLRKLTDKLFTTMKTLLLLLLSALLVGCGSTRVWYQAAKTPAEAHADFGECKMQAARAADPHGLGIVGGLGGFMARGIATGDFVKSCMFSKGYQPVAQNTLTNGAIWPRE